MTTARNLVLFVTATAAGFVYICNAIPQIKSEPVVEQPVIGSSPEELVAAGRTIFMSDRAQCLTCHSLGEDPKARCPNQEGLGARAPQRKAGMSAAEYLIESVYNPNAYVVSGYPKNQMRPVNKPPIALSHDEILAVLAFLNTLGGTTDADFIQRARRAQEPWRQGLLKPEEAAQEFKPPIFPGVASRGRQLFQQHCLKCHRIGNQGRDIGPELTKIGASQSADYILQSIFDPSAVIVRGFKQTIVAWKQPGRENLRGVPLAWLPNREHPQRLRLSVLESEEPQEREVDLSQAACVGDTVVGVETDQGFQSLCGDYVSGDEENGITLAFLENGRWVEREIPPDIIAFVNLPMSPMPANFAELMTPRQIYDLLAFLRAQKGQQ
ncbi:MAG: c-type cytochrome [Terriglobia bacterium]